MSNLMISKTLLMARSGELNSAAYAAKDADPAVAAATSSLCTLQGEYEATGGRRSYDGVWQDGAPSVLRRLNQAEKALDTAERPFIEGIKRLSATTEAVRAEFEAATYGLRGMPWGDIQEEIAADPEAYCFVTVVPTFGYTADIGRYLDAAKNGGEQLCFPLKITKDGKVVLSRTCNHLKVATCAVVHEPSVKWTADDFRG